jgi:hypothetical protein
LGLTPSGALYPSAGSRLDARPHAAELGCQAHTADLDMAKKRRAQIALMLVLSAVLLGLAGSFLVNRSIDETYSDGWYSASTENARYRGVFVRSPIVVPSRLCTSDSTEARVTDAWIERRTHVEYRWLIVRREVQDSLNRLVIHLAQVPRDSIVWRYSLGRGFVDVRFLMNGEAGGTSGNANVHTIFSLSAAPFPDTVRLTAVIGSSSGAPCAQRSATADGRRMASM